MKRLSIFLFLTLILMPTLSISAQQKRIIAPSRITAVTVYADRAQTTRSITLPLTPGNYLIMFDSLPTLIMDDSIRVEGTGTAAATITGIEVKRAFLEGSGEKKVMELQEEIRALERRSAALDARKSGITAQKLFFESIRVAWGDRISKELAVGRPTSAELQDAATFVGTGITKAEEQNREIEFDSAAIKDKINALRRQQREATGSGKKESKTVEVAVEIAREGTLKLSLLSLTSQANWEPSYDVRLATDARTAELTFRATVHQQSGEDWDNVDLTLSTAHPAAGGAPPELYPWLISLYRPQPMMPKTMPAAPTLMYSRAGKADIMQMESSAAEEAPAAFATAQVNNEQTSVSFHVPHTLNVPSDGSRHGTVVSVVQLPVSMEYLALPKLSPSVFLRSEMTNNATYPLLPGKVATFVGTSYTGSSQLKKVASGERFELFFGSDDQVTVKREEIKQQKEAGLFGNNRVRYRYMLELNNFRNDALTITLRDQLPIAADEEIKISLEDPSLKPEEIRNDGTITWKTPLSGGEKKTVTFGILVEYPKEREITGL
ncbi:MAG: mucoidy inhibitor MuiA family protein [Desulfuromonadaceae bacterium]|nr:mucoidy inhibitor MuiA family protein [Desulfuromonadaceae bacterium]